MAFAALPFILSLLGGAGAGAAGTKGGRNFLFGEKGKFQQLPTMNEGQQNSLQQLLEQLGGPQGSGLDYLQQILSGDEGAFSEFEAPYKRQFEQEIAPGLAERFAGMGTGGSLSSSGFQNSLAQGGRELSENLAALRGNLKQNALGQLQGFMQSAFRPSFENVYQQPRSGLLQGIGQGAAQGIGQAGMMYANPISALGRPPMGSPSLARNVM